MDLEPAGPDQGVKDLIQEREEARKAKDWDRADRLRDELKAMGIEVIDTKDGTLWQKKTE